jgi:hypothetical protein
MEYLFLAQLVSDVTRGPNILDLVLTNHPAMVSHNDVRPTIKLSDHSVIVTYLSSCDPPRSQDGSQQQSVYSSSIPKYDLTKGSVEDWIRYTTFLESSDWSIEAAGLSLEEKISLLTKQMESAVASVFSKKKGKTPGNRIPLTMRKLMTSRRKVGCRLLRTKCSVALNKLRDELGTIEAEIEASHTKARIKAETKVTKEIKSNPGAFYKYAAKFSKAPCKVGPLRDRSDNHTGDEAAMADILGSHYSTMYSVPRTPLTEELIETTFIMDPDSQSPTLTEISFNRVFVADALSALSNSAAPGPDGVPSLCLKRGELWSTRPWWTSLPPPWTLDWLMSL